jgi:hypothetical protein
MHLNSKVVLQHAEDGHTAGLINLGPGITTNNSYPSRCWQHPAVLRRFPCG